MSENSPEFSNPRQDQETIRGTKVKLFEDETIRLKKKICKKGPKKLRDVLAVTSRDDEDLENKEWTKSESGSTESEAEDRGGIVPIPKAEDGGKDDDRKMEDVFSSRGGINRTTLENANTSDCPNYAAAGQDYPKSDNVISNMLWISQNVDKLRNTPLLPKEETCSKHWIRAVEVYTKKIYTGGFGFPKSTSLAAPNLSLF